VTTQQALTSRKIIESRIFSLLRNLIIWKKRIRFLGVRQENGLLSF